MKEYTFDLKLFATLTFEAESEEEARQIMRDNMTLGSVHIWLNSTLGCAEASLDGEPDLIDGVAL